MAEMSPQHFIVPSKVSVPHLPANTVDRSRVEDLFVAACNGSAVILKAPAGFGKTIAALYGYYAYEEQRRETVLAWLSLDPEDDDPSVFAAYLVAAISHVVEWGDNVDEPFLNSHGQGLRSVINQLLVELDHLEHELMLVLDDFHLIQSEEIHSSLGFLIKHLPANVRIVLTTRSEPPANIMSLRLKGKVTEIGSDELAFTLPEAKAFFASFTQSTLSEHQVAEVLAHVEGWAVGLQLAVLGLRHGASPTRNADALSYKNLNIVDYFDSELFSGLHSDVQDFLLSTAMVRRYNIEVAAALCPTINVHEVLDYLQRQHLFIVQFHEAREWYRYHHLLQEFLQHKLQVSFSDRLPELHRRASDVFLRLGYVVDAVDHAIKSGDKGRVTSILAVHGNDLIHKAHYDLVRRCLAELTEADILQDANLVLVRCWVEAIFGDATLVPRLLEHARPLLARLGGEERRQLEADMLTVHSQAAFSMLQYEHASGYARDALALYADDSVRRQGALLILANVLFEQGDIVSALAIYEESEILSRQEANYDAVLWSLNQQSVIWKSRGRFARSADLSRDAISYASAQGVRQGFNVVFAHINQADIALEEYHLGEARQLIHRIQNLCETWDAHWQLHLQGWLLKCEMLKGKPTLAREFATEHEQILSQEYTADVLMPYSTEAQLLWWWQNKDVKKIQTWLKAKPVITDCCSIRDFMLLRAEAYGLLALGEYTAVRQKLRRGVRQADSMGFQVESVRMGLLEATAAELAGDHEQATRLVRRLLPLAADLQLVASWLFLRQPLMPLLERQLKTEVFKAQVAQYAEQLLMLHRQRNTAIKPGSEQIPDSLVAAGVSRKEWRVYKHILAGRSNEEIAGTMFVAISTVKTHINNLYKKLGVRNRQEAIARGKSYTSGMQ